VPLELSARYQHRRQRTVEGEVLSADDYVQNTAMVVITGRLGWQREVPVVQSQVSGGRGELGAQSDERR
jgi:hypothetical protein